MCWATGQRPCAPNSCDRSGYRHQGVYRPSWWASVGPGPHSRRCLPWLWRPELQPEDDNSVTLCWLLHCNCKWERFRILIIYSKYFLNICTIYICALFLYWQSYEYLALRPRGPHVYFFFYQHDKVASVFYFYFPVLCDNTDNLYTLSTALFSRLLHIVNSLYTYILSEKK